MLLIHPERLNDYNDLWVDCTGDEYSADADETFCDVPMFFFDGGMVKVDAHMNNDALNRSGSATGFVPQ